MATLLLTAGIGVAPVEIVRPKALTLTPEPGSRYYFVKVTQADGDVLYSAPIWITTPEA